MSDSVGSVSVDVVPDARGWAEKLRAQIRDVTVKPKVSPEVDPAAEEEVGKKGKSSGDKFSGEFDRTVQTRIRAALEAIPDLNINADTTSAALQLDLLKGDLQSLSSQKIGVDISTADALERIATVRAQLAELGASSPDVQVNVDSLAAQAALAGIQARVDELNGKKVTTRVDVDRGPIDRASGALDGFFGKLGFLPGLALAATPALIPLAAALGGVTLALGAPLAIAGGGATLFGFLAGFAVKQTNAQLKQIASLQKKVDDATKGTQAYTDAQKALHDAQKALSPAQVEFSNSLGLLKADFQNFLSGPAGNALLGVMTQGIQLLTHLLPIATPLVSAISGAFGGLLGELADGAKSKGFQTFVDQFGRLAARDITGLAHIFGNLAGGLGSLVLLLDKKLGGNLVQMLVGLSGQFDHWSSSDRGRRAVQSFLDYFHRVGPDVASSVGAVARAIGHIVTALAPLGPVALRVIEGIANSISAVPIPVLTALAGVLGSMIVLQKLGGFKVAGGLSKLLGGKFSIFGNRGATPANPMYVFSVNGGGGVPGLPGGGDKGPLGKIPGGGKMLPLYTLQGALLGAIFYEGAKGDIHGIQSIKPFGQSTVQQRVSPTLGGNPDPRSPNYANASTTPGVRYYNAQTGKFYIGGGPGDPTMTGNDRITKTQRHVDALREGLARASREIDMVGPHADNAFGQASHDVDTFTTKLDNIHDKHFRVIAETQAAVNRLEDLQRFRLKDKAFSVALELQIERAVGPGGGMGRPVGPDVGGGSGGGAGATYTGNIHINASDHADFQRQMQQRHRRSALSGVNGP